MILVQCLKWTKFGVVDDTSLFHHLILNPKTNAITPRILVRQKNGPKLIDKNTTKQQN